MKTINQWFDEYAVSHQNKTNKIIHWICIPAIFISILGLVSAIPSQVVKGIFPEIVQEYANWGSLLLLLVLVFYLVHSIKLFIGMLIWSVFCIWVVSQLNISTIPLWQSSIVIFIVAWIGQFYGHHIEGKKPSFLKDIQFLLIGPAWLMSFIYTKLRIKY